jgi:hypothetical protein
MLDRQALSKVSLAPYDKSLPFQPYSFNNIVNNGLDILSPKLFIMERHPQILKGEIAQLTSEDPSIVITFTLF